MLFASSDVFVINPITAQLHLSTGITDSIYRVADTYLQSPLPVDLFLIPGETLRVTVNAIAGPITLSTFYISYDQWIIA